MKKLKYINNIIYLTISTNLFVCLKVDCYCTVKFTRVIEVHSLFFFLYILLIFQRILEEHFSSFSKEH